MATLKMFARKNENNLFSCEKSSFDGMVDCVMDNDSGFSKSGFTTNTYYKSGIDGIYTVGSSRDYFTKFEDDNFIGIEVYNCCGKSILAIKK